MADDDSNWDYRVVSSRVHHRSKAAAQKRAQIRTTPPSSQKIAASSILAKSNASSPRLDAQISRLQSDPMKYRARLVNWILLSGTLSLAVMSFAVVNFFMVLNASPDTIAKVRFIKMGMTLSGSVCIFLNSFCIFIICVCFKYAIEHYVAPVLRR